jgi:hypothetical protein
MKTSICSITKYLLTNKYGSDDMRLWDGNRKSNAHCSSASYCSHESNILGQVLGELRRACEVLEECEHCKTAMLYAIF